jgi:hypothetical protein
MQNREVGTYSTLKPENNGTNYPFYPTSLHTNVIHFRKDGGSPEKNNKNIHKVLIMCFLKVPG